MGNVSLKKLHSRLVINWLKNFCGVRGKLIYFIQTNNLYLLDQKDLDQISLSVSINYRKIKTPNESYLIIKINKTGSIVDDNLSDLTNQLQALFSGYVLEVVNSLNFIKYKILTSNRVEEFYLFDNCVNYKGKSYIDVSRNLRWEFDKVPSCGIWGSSGSGKTYLALTMLKKISTLTPNVFVSDCKFDEFSYYSKKIGIKNVATDIEEVCESIKKVSDILDKRYKSEKPKKFSPVFLFIDEFAILKLSVGKKKFEELIGYIRNIILKGRRARVFIILIQQYQNTNLGIPMDLLSSLGLKIVFGNSVQLYKNVFEVSKDIDLITKNIGEGYYSQNGNEVKLLFAPYIMDLEEK